MTKENTTGRTIRIFAIVAVLWLGAGAIIAHTAQDASAAAPAGTNTAVFNAACPTNYVSSGTCTLSHLISAASTSGTAPFTATFYSFVRPGYMINSSDALALNFGDGTEIQAPYCGGQYSGQPQSCSIYGSVTHKYTSPGTYNVELLDYACESGSCKVLVDSTSVTISPAAQKITSTVVPSCDFGTSTTGGECRGYLTSVGTGTFTVPADWSSTNTIEVIGGGGGSIGAGNSFGGGGGAYAKSTDLNLTVNQQVSYNVGRAGSTASGGDTVFNGTTSVCDPTQTTEVCAKGGWGGQGDAWQGRGGAAAASVGQVTYSGGNAGAGNGNTGGGGGGGAAGPLGNGWNGGLSSGNAGGGGGADAGSGTVGTNGTQNASGAGGAGPTGTAGGAGGAKGVKGGVGTNGSGGGGGGSKAAGGAGGSGTEWDATHGAGAGGGGGGDIAPQGSAGAGGTYGGGAGGSNGTGVGADGGQGIIVITYTPAN